MKNQFATAVTCMDGRIQTYVIEYLKEKFDVPFIDVITEPGPNGILAEGTDRTVIENIRRRIDISVNKHKSEWIVLVGHEDCAGNPGPKEKQIEDVKSGIELIEQMDFSANILGLWVDLAGNFEIIKERRCMEVG